MKVSRVRDFTRGWFVGDFDPSLIKTSGAEVAIQEYEAGDNEPCHWHAECKEITALVEGTAIISGHTEEYHMIAGDIVFIECCEPVRFRALTKVIAVVVKVPSRPHDKVLCSEDHQ